MRREPRVFRFGGLATKGDEMSAKRFSIMMPDDLGLRLRIQAATEGKPVNEVVRQAVLDYLDHLEGPITVIDGKIAFLMEERDERFRNI